MTTPSNPDGPLRVAFVLRVLQGYRLPLFRRLQEARGLEVRVFHGPSFPGTKLVNGPNPGLVDAEELQSLKLRLSTQHGLAAAPFSPRLPAALARFRPDAIICEGASNLPNNLLAYAYAGWTDTPILQWGLGAIKGRPPSRARRMLEPLIQLMERRADACIAYSTRGARYYRDVGVAPDRIIVATNVVDTEARKEAMFGIDAAALYAEAHLDSDFVVLYVGGLARGKRVEMLVDAFREHVRRTDRPGARARLWIVGDGPLRPELERRASGLGDQVRFFGRVSDGVSRHFVAADVFVLPGLGGLAISDAMVHGLPVIATIGDGVEADLVTPDTGFLDDELDASRIARYLDILRADPELRKSLAEGARTKIDTGANIDNYVQRIDEAVRLSLRGRTG